MDGATLAVSPARGLAGTDRRFVAYAAHELRGEITLQLAVAETTLADPHADTTSLRKMGELVVAACERQERLLEALLTLARSEHGRLRREPVDLAATAARVLRAQRDRQLRRAITLEPARTTGDPQLIERLLANLIENAVRHNTPGGRLEVATYAAADRAVFTIANTGPVIPAGEVSGLFQPFQRLRPHADPSANGVGLGLAIVEAIADAHDAMVRAEARVGGGLAVDVDFPAQPVGPLIELQHERCGQRDADQSRREGKPGPELVDGVEAAGICSVQSRSAHRAP